MKEKHLAKTRLAEKSVGNSGLISSCYSTEVLEILLVVVPYYVLRSVYHMAVWLTWFYRLPLIKWLIEFDVFRE